MPEFHTSADYIDLLEAIVERLKSQVAAFSQPGCCFLTLNPDEVPPSPGDLVAAVAPMSGEFNPQYFDGGGIAQFETETGFIVKIHSPVCLDEPGSNEHFLLNREGTLGVLRSMHEVIEAFAEWTPINRDGLGMVRDLIQPRHFAFTKSSQRIGAVEIVFTLNFDYHVTD